MLIYLHSQISGTLKVERIMEVAPKLRIDRPDGTWALIRELPRDKSPLPYREPVALYRPDSQFGSPAELIEPLPPDIIDTCIDKSFKGI